MVLGLLARVVRSYSSGAIKVSTHIVSKNEMQTKGLSSIQFQEAMNKMGAIWTEALSGPGGVLYEGYLLHNDSKVGDTFDVTFNAGVVTWNSSNPDVIEAIKKTLDAVHVVGDCDNQAVS